MSAEEYKSILEPTELLSELRRLLLAQHQADRLICRYLADLADGMAKWPLLLMGYGDVYALVRARFGLSLRSIRERIRVGRALRQLPTLEAALISGHLTYSRIREVTRVATPGDERIWVEVARRMSMRALEERVANASGEPRGSRRRESGHPREPAKVTLSISVDVWALLERAMQAERAASGLELSDEEALAAVARSALSQLDSVPAGRPLSARPATTDSAAETSQASLRREGAWEQKTTQTTHSGSLTVGAAEGEATPSGLRRDRGVEEDMTHSESLPPAASRVDDVSPPLSPDAQLLLELIRTGGAWDAGTLCEVTEMHPQRLSCALADLEFAHLVTRGMFGVFEAAQGRTGGGRFKKTG